MAKAQFNVALTGLRGKIGNFVFRMVGGQQVVSEATDYSRRPRNARQAACSRHFGRAAKYAKAGLADPQQRPAIERRARRLGLTARGYLIKEYYRLHPVPKRKGRARRK